MISLRECVGRELKWVQPHTLQMEYELRDGDELAATLRFRSGFGTLATAESADGCWTFKRVGFWQTRVTIRPCGAETELAQFRNNTWGSGGTLELPDGRHYPANTNFWMTEYAFRTADGQPVVTYRQIGGVLHSSSMLTIEPAAAGLAELPWLAALGWYLTVMMQMDSAATVAVTTAAVTTTAATTVVH